MRSEWKYPFEKTWGFDVDRTAPLSHQHASIITLALTYDLAVHKHWNQWTLWEPSHVGLKDIYIEKLIDWVYYYVVCINGLPGSIQFVPLGALPQ